ncbi:MAG TPA: phenylalanine--tRNA ligase subunit beta [Anaerolineales bacterium]|nr:phenylalanine--tRNA ligase subunit beta [Anaerolineales bacterium]
MKVPISWVKDYVDISLSLEELAHALTMAGLEVEEIRYVGLPLPQNKFEHPSGSHQRAETKVQGLAWGPDKIVTAAVLEVMPHPNADRLVLCRLVDDEREHIVLTGAPNLYPYKGIGELEKPLKVAYAKEGAQIYDGHQPGQVLTTLKRAKIRGVESYSMICSEKELGISDEHEGVIILDEDAPVGMSLVEYMGDAVFEIAITPNIARDANILGIAREIAAITGQPMRSLPDRLQMNGPSIEGKAFIEIRNPELNPRFVLGLVQDIQIGESPYWMQRRLRLAGMRPINNIVDATNYAMLEIGEPLHAFDFDILLKRAGGQAPTIITRTAQPGEKLTTLDDVEHTLDDFTVLVCDTAGALSIAGVMGGAESEVHPGTQNVLLEGAAWNFINIRRTIAAQHMQSEAAYRFSRGVHPAIAERGVRRCLELMQQTSGGVVAQGLVDHYPLPPQDPMVEINSQDVLRWLGISLNLQEIAEILNRLEFKTEIAGDVVRATTPDHRLDIGEGMTGKADVLEEIARIYGYERIPETRMADELPPQKGNLFLEGEERIRELLVGLGLQEVVTYRMTSAEKEARLYLAGSIPAPEGYVKLANPIVAERNVLRQSLLSSLMEIVERNARLRERIALFEIGPQFVADPEGDLPQEPIHLAIALNGRRTLPTWQGFDEGVMDFYDLKGILSELFDSLHLASVRFTPGERPSMHPGKCAQIWLGEQVIGVFGELHPLVHENYDLSEYPVLAAEINLEAWLANLHDRYSVAPVPPFPPVLEDLAIIVAENLPADQVAQVIRQAAGAMLSDLRLFDVYRGAQIGEGKKSLAYSLTYQAADRTLTDQEVLKIRQRILRTLEQEIGAYLRS